MSLPPGFLDELRSRASLAQIVGRKVTWDMRKSQQGKGDWWAPCPFHQEKTASFHVDDRKGFYYCFGCHASGDALGFVMQSENVPFIEAVKILAAEAGMVLPERDPQAAEKADRREVLRQVVAEAVKFYRLTLAGAAGQAARDYLAGRGFGPDVQARWEMGFAPAEWRRVIEHLKAKGIAPDLIAAAGLSKTGARGGEPYDVFRNRIMVPIRDGQGRPVAFGGRALDPDDTAKYLNSPETELFDKGRQLFNMAQARSAGRDAQLVVAEGYLDVIALSEAGFRAAVAPLGTAITADQLKLMWRIHPEPIVALDGDAAGQRAAIRTMEIALPILEAGRSLRFCLLPDGQDPDDVLRARGPAAMQALLDEARPMVDLLWRRETHGVPLDSPERRAALDKRLREVLSTISDRSIRRHYADAIKELRWQLFNPRQGRGARGAARARSASSAARRSEIVSVSEMDRLREMVVLALLIRHPALAETFEPALERVVFTDPGHAAILQCLLSDPAGDETACRRAIAASPAAPALEKLDAARHLNVVPALRSGDEAAARQCLASEIAKLVNRRGAAREIEEALLDIEGVADEALTWRLAQAARSRSETDDIRAEDHASYELASNGVLLDRKEVDAWGELLRELGFSRDDAKK